MITLDQIKSWDQCYDAAEFEKFFAGRASVTPQDILDLPLPPENRLAILLREDCVPAPVLQEFACQCAERALALVDVPHPHAVAAIAAKRAWLHGEINNAALDKAEDAARSAAEAAAGAALAMETRLSVDATDWVGRAIEATIRAATWATLREASWAAVFAATAAAAAAAACAVTGNSKSFESVTRAAQLELLRELLDNKNHQITEEQRHEQSSDNTVDR